MESRFFLSGRRGRDPAQTAQSRRSGRVFEESRGQGLHGDQAYVLRGLGVPNVYGDLPPAARNLAADRTLHQHRSARLPAAFKRRSERLNSGSRRRRPQLAMITHRDVPAHLLAPLQRLDTLAIRLGAGHGNSCHVGRRRHQIDGAGDLENGSPQAGCPSGTASRNQRRGETLDLFHRK